MDLLASYGVSVETEVQQDPEPVIMTEKQFRSFQNFCDILFLVVDDR